MYLNDVTIVACSKAAVVVGKCASNLTHCKSFCAHWPPITCNLEKVICSSFPKYQTGIRTRYVTYKQTIKERVSNSTVVFSTAQSKSRKQFLRSEAVYAELYSRVTAAAGVKLTWVIPPGFWVATSMCCVTFSGDEGASGHSKCNRIHFAGLLKSRFQFRFVLWISGRSRHCVSQQKVNEQVEPI